MDRLVLIVPAAHPLAGRGVIRFAEVVGEAFVWLSAGALHSHLAHPAPRLGRQINYGVRLRIFDAIARLGDAGVCLGILPMAAAATCAMGGIAVVPLAYDWANRKLLICAPDFAASSGHARLFVDHIEKQAEQVTHRSV